MQIKYTIKDLERLSGIKAHTIRIWEQRYNLLSPARGGRNIRSYSNEELKKLLNVNFLGQCGFKISEIACLTEEELRQKVAAVTQSNYVASSDYINMLILSMIEMDEAKFHGVINDNLKHSDFEKCIDEVVFPFLRKIGVMWQVGDVNPAQEHFISHLIRQKIIANIDAIPLNAKKSTLTYLLYLPEGEWHELSLLYYTYLLKKLGLKYIYLGQSVPFNDIVAVLSEIMPNCLITVITTPLADGTLEDYLQSMSKLMLHGQILVTGFQLSKHLSPLPANVKIFAETKQFYELLEPKMK